MKRFYGFSKIKLFSCRDLLDNSLKSIYLVLNQHSFCTDFLF